VRPPAGERNDGKNQAMVKTSQSKEEDETGDGRGAKWALLAVPDFWRLWFVGLVLFSVRWLELLAMAVVVYQRSASPFLVAIITMLRLLPMALFGAFAGAVADRIDRRRTLVFVVLCLMLTSAMLALLALFDALEIWHLALASFLNGTAWATDNPVRRIMIGEVVGAHSIGPAMSLDIGTNNASRMIGPLIGGVMLENVGIHGVFMLSVALYATAAVTALTLRFRSRIVAGTGGHLFAHIVDGLVIVRREKRLVGALTITVIFNVFGWPFTSMIPVIGQDSLLLDPKGIGLLASMDGLGAFLGAVVIALYAKPQAYARLYVGGTAIYLVLLPVFALVSTPLLAGATLLATGLTGAAFTVMQSTLIYLLAAPEARSRVFGALSMCIGLGPIGFVHLGLLADAIGARWATATIGVEGIVILALTSPLWLKVVRGDLAAAA
jgi:MFS family permease